MGTVTVIGASVFYYPDAFAHIVRFIASMGTVKRCPACNHCFVSEKEVFLRHLITECNKKDVELYTWGQVDREVERIECLLGIARSTTAKKEICILMPDPVEGFVTLVTITR